jgi:hypothetical protein
MTGDGGSRVFAGDGRVLTLDRTLKSGGAGSIHRIVGVPELVAKIYHPQVDHAIYERKVEAMINLVPDLPDIAEGGVREVQIAWPRFLLRDPQRRFVGFAMPLIDFAGSVELECVLQERQARAQGLPTGLGAKVTLAANLAALIAELHRQGHYAVDLKPVNLRFYRRSLHIAMLDCDGCSIKGDGERFSAPQFTPDYLAPEFQQQGVSAGSDQASKEESQDRFALAVVVFQLLNFGIHPFTGRPASERIPTDIPGRIAHRCYAYGLRANPQMAPNPASGHTVMPMELRQLFDRAFTAIGLARPSAGDWVDRLRAYGRRSTGLLVACRANALHQHFAGLPCGACARQALLTRAASVVRTQARKAPEWTARRAAPPVFTAAWSPPPTPSFKSSSWMPALVVGPVLFVLLILVPSWCSRPRTRITHATEETTQETRATDRLEPAANLDEVLAAASGADEKAIARQLSRLPSRLDGPDQKQCRAAAASWREKVEWTRDDPAYAGDGYLSSRESRPQPCADLYLLVLRIVRTQELCKRRLDSPGAYPGIGEAECEKNRVIEAGVDTLRRALLYGHALELAVWEGMAEAFVLNDDYENAEAAFVIWALLYRAVGFDEGTVSMSVIEEGWLRHREEILRARAWATIHSWNGEPVSDEIKAKLRAPWPKEPPPKKPRRRRARMDSSTPLESGSASAP